jgi:hypothetical protein
MTVEIKVGPMRLGLSIADLAPRFDAMHADGRDVEALRRLNSETPVDIITHRQITQEAA